MNQNVRNHRICRPARGGCRFCSAGSQRLEYRGYDSAGMATLNGGARWKFAAPSASSKICATLLDESPLNGSDRNRPYAMGDARAAVGGQRASASRRARSRSSITASSRTTSSCAPRCSSAATSSSSETDTELISHLIEERLRARPGLDRGGARGGPRIARVVLDRGAVRDRAGQAGRRQDRDAAGAGPGRRREFRRLRYSGDPRAYAARTIVLEDGELAELSAQRRAPDDLRRRARSIAQPRATSNGTRSPRPRAASSTICARRSPSSRRRGSIR